MIDMTKNRKLISIVTPCYNELNNLPELIARIHGAMDPLQSKYDYDILIIDNCSTDGSIELLRELAGKDKRIKVILNSRNFGHIRSPYHGILSATGDAVVLIASDLQDPPENIPLFIKMWEEGYKTVLAVKPKSEESKAMFLMRRLYYFLLNKISEIPLINNATGAGLFDRVIIDNLKKIDVPYPYFRGLLCEVGFKTGFVEFTQPKRSRGVTKNNFYTLYDIAMLGVVSHSKVPLRMMSIVGFSFSVIFFLIALIFLVSKLLFWSMFSFGQAPALIGIFFVASVQLFVSGILGEYIGAIYTQTRKMPVVIEAERINFE